MDDVRLIDANRLLKVCKEAYHYEDSRGKLGYCIDAIKHAPTIDAQPLAHTVNLSEVATCDEFTCSECDFRIRNWERVVPIEYEDGYIDHTIQEYELKFCPNCGKKIEYV